MYIFAIARPEGVGTTWHCEKNKVSAQSLKAWVHPVVWEKVMLVGVELFEELFDILGIMFIYFPFITLMSIQS